MSTAVVTGSSGDLGEWVVGRLARSGWEVRCLDHSQPADETHENVTVVETDLTDQGETLGAVLDADPDAVVHLAAVGPYYYAPSRVYANNTLAAYHALVAAGEAGADVVWTSSESIYGWVFADEQYPPDSLPVRVDHPCRPEDQYGVSKEAAEATARMVARRYDVPVTTIRPSWIQHPGAYECTAADGEDVVNNFWSYVDVRDVVRLVERALDSPPDGEETVQAVTDENYLGRPTRELFEETYGPVPSPCELEGTESALSNARAAEVFDWTPGYSYIDDAEDDVGPWDDW
jgi:nucleoside-diphosphate-sugar epimerase